MKFVDLALFFFISLILMSCLHKTQRNKISKSNTNNIQLSNHENIADLKKNDSNFKRNTRLYLKENNSIYYFTDSSLDTNKKTIYLTFDDGPLEGTTKVMDICEHHQIPASFFIVGLHSSNSIYGKEMIKKLKEKSPLFEIFNHTFTHANNQYNEYYKHPVKVVNDLKLCFDSIHLQTLICRLPGNNIWLTPYTRYYRPQYYKTVNAIDSTNFQIIGWDLEWDFTKSCRPMQSVADMLEMVDSSFVKEHRLKTPKNAVILMHDNMFRASSDSVKLDEFIKGLKSRNYQFATINNYPHFIKK